MEKRDILNEILELDSYFRHSKKFFRFIDDEDINKYETQPYNVNPQTKFIMKFDQPISKDLQLLHSRVGHYLNQNYLIRLYEILKHYKIAGKNLDNTLRGSEDIEILWELKCKFAHGLGKYDSAIKEDRDILAKLMFRYKEEHIVEDEFLISQDKTIKQIIHGIVSYLKDEQK